MDTLSSGRRPKSQRICTESSKLKPQTKAFIGLTTIILAGLTMGCSPKDPTSADSLSKVKPGDTPSDAQKDAMRSGHTRSGMQGGGMQGGQGGGYGGGYGGRPMGMGGGSGSMGGSGSQGR
jgi:hypothetical protein